MVVQDGVAKVGSTVTVRDWTGIDTWTIVPAGESDPSRRRINEDCAMARALLGHTVGETVRVQGSRRGWTVEILRVG